MQLENFYNQILTNLSLVGIVFVIFILSVVSSILSSSFYNIHVLKEAYNPSKMIRGIIKMLITGIATGILAIIATIFPYILNLGGIAISEELEQIYTITAIIGIYINGIFKYYKKSYITLKEIIENQKSEDVDDWIEVNFNEEEIE